MEDLIGSISVTNGYKPCNLVTGYKPITGQLTGPLVWGLWLQMVAGPNLS